MAKNNRQKQAAVNLLSNFGGKINKSVPKVEEAKVEETVEPVKVEEPVVSEEKLEVKEALPEVIGEPVGQQKYEFTEVNFPVAPVTVVVEEVKVEEVKVEEKVEAIEPAEVEKKVAEVMEAMVTEEAVEAAIKEDTKAKEKTVPYNFHIPFSVVKRLNRVIDEMKENDEKMTKKDFIAMAVERAVAEYEKRYKIN